jgi:phage gp29-like protein
MPSGFSEAQRGIHEGTTDIETYPDQLDDAITDALAGMIDGVKDLVMNAGSLEDIRDGLMDLYPEIGTKEFGSIMQRALIAASMLGSVEVKGA